MMECKMLDGRTKWVSRDKLQYRPASYAIVFHLDRILLLNTRTIWFDVQHKVGFFEPIGTVPAYRRRGLGKALMLEGFRRLQKLGESRAYLGIAVVNNAGNHLYESVGRPVFDQEHWWKKAF